MIKNPLHLRLEKLAPWQLTTFMVCLCERMYPNFALYYQEQGAQPDHDQNNQKLAISAQKTYKNMLDLIWESLLVKKAKINFDLQLEKLEAIIPLKHDDSPYIINPAIDACQGLSELLHAFLTEELLEHAIAVSLLSIKTVAELEMTKIGKELTEEELKNFQPVLDELDIQWEFYRLLKESEEDRITLIKGLRDELREEKISNIGVFLSN